MAYGDIGFSQIGDSRQKSPSIWGDCPNTLLQDKGLGYFVHEDFLGGPVVNTTITSALLGRLSVGNGFSIDGDDDTVLTHKAAEIGGYLDLETDGDDNDAAAYFTQPLGPITRNSGNKLWAEIRIELGAVADQGVFFGIAEEAALSRDVIADNIASNGVIGESLMGFLVDNGDTNAFDIVLRKDGGTVVNILNDSTNSVAIPLASRASITADVEFKLGIRFNGRDKIYFYVNGYEVAAYDVDSTVDQSKSYAAIFAIKTGTAAAQSIAVDFVSAGYSSRA